MWPVYVIFQKTFYQKKCGLESSSRSLLIYKSSVKRISMLIWRSFESFAITYLGSLLQKIHFPIEVVLLSLQAQKGLELGVSFCRIF